MSGAAVGRRFAGVLGALLLVRVIASGPPAGILTPQLLAGSTA
ncbi:hypothetical protein ACF05T_13465 [Streptomyces lateritius]|uniref:MFS transporter n=1 Tax=Streptomyces lateritius TaxID=67313 RepID=A0ABW6YB90_9ACTN